MAKCIRLVSETRKAKMSNAISRILGNGKKGSQQFNDLVALLINK